MISDRYTPRDDEDKKRRIGVIYESSYNMLLVDLVYEREGQYFAYERIVPTAIDSAVVVLPIYMENIIIMKKYRHAIRECQYAIPRGFAEDNITVEDNVKKELWEEIGAKTGKITYLGEIVADSGLSGGHVEAYAW